MQIPYIHIPLWKDIHIPVHTVHTEATYHIQIYSTYGKTLSVMALSVFGRSPPPGGEAHSVDLVMSVRLLIHPKP